MTTISGLDAASFVYSSTRRDTYFETVLTACVEVYKEIINSSIELEDNENKIRDKFLKYLQNLDFKKSHELKNLKFDKETTENAGRADIRVLPTKDEYINDEEYYIIECKRLDSHNTKGTTGLNAEYVKNGICRFVSGYYSTYYGCNAMFGFVVEHVDIENDIVNSINSMLNVTMTNDHDIDVNANVIQQMSFQDFANSYPYSYLSTHTHISGKELALYHLMFDFSNNII
ncbi:MAG: hypothetical protein IJL04_00175 [Bacteroidales bacterium]|nr:hypothetical protein [Bacteroidales bacterium]MBQ6100689.1 hypothetical protein [Bacteroidales bacterium]